MKICEGYVEYGNGFTQEHQSIAYERDEQDIESHKYMCPLCLANLTIQRLSEDLETVSEQLERATDELEEEDVKRNM